MSEKYDSQKYIGPDTLIRRRHDLISGSSEEGQRKRAARREKELQQGGFFGDNSGAEQRLAFMNVEIFKSACEVRLGDENFYSEAELNAMNSEELSVYQTTLEQFLDTRNAASGERNLFIQDLCKSKIYDQKKPFFFKDWEMRNMTRGEKLLCKGMQILARLERSDFYEISEVHKMSHNHLVVYKTTIEDFIRKASDDEIAARISFAFTHGELLQEFELSAMSATQKDLYHRLLTFHKNYIEYLNASCRLKEDALQKFIPHERSLYDAMLSQAAHTKLSAPKFV
jgi:hypothetical protein